MEKYQRTWQYECYKLSVRDGSSVSFNSRLCQTKEEESKELPGKFLGYGFSHYTVADDAFIARALLIMLWRVTSFNVTFQSKTRVGEWGVPGDGHTGREGGALGDSATRVSQE